MTSPPRVLLWNAYAAAHAERLRRELTTPWEIAASVESEPPAAREAALRSCNALVSSRFGAEMPKGLTLNELSLRLIQTPTSGYDRIEPALLPPGCVVCNVHEHETAIAEYVLAALLHWTVPIADLDRSFRAGDWNGGVARPGHMHGEIGGRTLGIIGYGRIGAQVARRAKAFAMRVLAVSRTASGQDGHVDCLEGMDALDAMLPQCDFVLVACPLDETTRGLIDARRLALMKRSAVLINVARAAIVVEEALFAALQSRAIAGAVLDVWYAYPTPQAPDAEPSRLPFRSLPNVLVTPHASAWTNELIERRWRFIAANLDRMFRGEQPANIVIRQAN